MPFLNSSPLSFYQICNINYFYLVGDPSILYLDEPTTGMDPISRRQVWDVIMEAKRNRAIILTTHRYAFKKKADSSFWCRSKFSQMKFSSSLLVFFFVLVLCHMYFFDIQYGRGWRSWRSHCDHGPRASPLYWHIQPSEEKIRRRVSAVDTHNEIVRENKGFFENIFLFGETQYTWLFLDLLYPFGRPLFLRQDFLRDKYSLIPAEIGVSHDTYTISRDDKSKIPLILRDLSETGFLDGTASRDIQIRLTTLEEVWRKIDH